MRLISYFLVLSFAFCQNSVPYIAVVGLDALGIDPIQVQILEVRLGNELANISGYRLIERNQINTVLEEQSFQLSGCTDNKCIVEVGMLLNADYVITGAIGHIGSTYTISLRMLNTRTAEVTNTADYDYTGEIDNLLKIGIRNAAQKLLKNTEQVAMNTNIQGISQSASVADNNFQYNSMLQIWMGQRVPVEIQTKNGNRFQGVIKYSGNENDIDILTRKGFQFSISKQDITLISVISPPKFNIGLGLGLAYGILGISGEYEFWDNFTAVIGLGSTILTEETGYGYGIRYYFSKPTNRFRPRLSLLYGTNAFFQYSEEYSINYTVTSTYDYNEILTGVDICFGFIIYFGKNDKHAIDLDIAYLPGIQDIIKEKVDELESEGWHIEEYNEGAPIDFSLGYRYRF